MQPILFFLLFLSNAALPVLGLGDNSILGEPYVDCGGDHMEVVCFATFFYNIIFRHWQRFDTRNTFRGIVFVEGHLEEPQCRSSPVLDDTASGTRNAQIRLDFRSCGINQTRHVSHCQKVPSILFGQDDPKGVFLSARLVVAFNPQYLSKFDRVYELRCFYMEMEHQLEKQLTVKFITLCPFSLWQLLPPF